MSLVASTEDLNTSQSLFLRCKKWFGKFAAQTATDDMLRKAACGVTAQEQDVCTSSAEWMDFICREKVTEVDVFLQASL